MAVGVSRDRLMVRTDAASAKRLVSEPHARPMDFTGRPLKGFLFVDAGGLRTTAALRTWVARATGFAESLPEKAAKRPRAPRRKAPAGRGRRS